MAAPTGVARSGPASTAGGALTRTLAASLPMAQAEPLSSVTVSSTACGPGVEKLRSTCGPSRTTPSEKRQRQAVSVPSPSAESAGVEGDGVAGADDAVGAGLGGGRLVDADVDLLGAAARGEVAAVVEGDGDREDAGLLEGVRGGRAFRAGAVAEEPGGLQVLGVLGDGPGVRDAGAERRRRGQVGDRRRGDGDGAGGGDAAVGDAGVVGGGERDPVGAGLGEAVLRLHAGGGGAVAEVPGEAGDGAVGVAGAGAVEEDEARRPRPGRARR